jgi:hypothetical protein
VANVVNPVDKMETYTQLILFCILFLQIYDDSESINKYATRRDVGEQGARLAFNTHADAAIFVCFTNTLSDGM